MTVRNGRSRGCREERTDAPRHARPCGDGGAEGGREGVKGEGKDKSDAKGGKGGRKYRGGEW